MLTENIERVRKNIAAACALHGRDAAQVTIVAVTKTVGLEQVLEAASLGLTDFGENRTREAAPKVKALPSLKWHFIGHLQSNKAREVLPAYSLIHSLDRLSLARALQREAEKLGKPVSALVQVNVSGEDSKFGVNPAKLEALLRELRAFDAIVLRGLMTMAPFYSNPEATRPCFSRLRELRDRCLETEPRIRELSMGMTNDYTVAVEEGATMVRVGSAIFTKA